MKMHDTHCHIDLYDDPARIAKQVERDGIFTIAVTNLPSAYVEAVPYVKAFPHLHLALGLHPLLAVHHTQKQKDLFQKCFSQASYIGEIGLDFSREGIETKETQINSFRFVLRLLAAHKRVVTVHSRRAENAVLSLLNEYMVTPIIFHWYSGSVSLIPQILNSGHYFSVNPAMIASKSGQAVIRHIPQNRILVETDGPFVKTENRLAAPSDGHLVSAYLASGWNMAAGSVEDILEQNLRTLLMGCDVPQKE